MLILNFLVLFPGIPDSRNDRMLRALHPTPTRHRTDKQRRGIGILPHSAKAHQRNVISRVSCHHLFHSFSNGLAASGVVLLGSLRAFSSDPLGKWKRGMANSLT
jgi:hypothetical protein